MIRIICPYCDNKIDLADKYAGVQMHCGSCGSRIEVPGSNCLRGPEQLVIHFKCSTCGLKLKTVPKYSGRKCKCPKCQQQLVIPEHFDHLSLAETESGDEITDAMLESHAGTTEFLKELGETGDLDEMVDDVLGLNQDKKKDS